MPEQDLGGVQQRGTWILDIGHSFSFRVHTLDLSYYFQTMGQTLGLADDLLDLRATEVLEGSRGIPTEPGQGRRRVFQVHATIPCAANLVVPYQVAPFEGLVQLVIATGVTHDLQHPRDRSVLANPARTGGTLLEVFHQAHVNVVGVANVHVSFAQEQDVREIFGVWGGFDHAVLPADPDAQGRALSQEGVQIVIIAGRRGYRRAERR